MNLLTMQCTTLPVLHFDSESDDGRQALIADIYFSQKYIKLPTFSMVFVFYEAMFYDKMYLQAR